MSVKTRTITPHHLPPLSEEIESSQPHREKALEVVNLLSLADLHWLRGLLDTLLDDESSEYPTWDEDDDELPESATLDEAIELYLADKCSLGRAAELAGVTRWHLQDMLYERGTPASLGSDLTLSEIDDMVDMVEERYGYRE
ncbi:MAG: UPF0175 family protein [Ardenticatenaceae bacterium]